MFSSALYSLLGGTAFRLILTFVMERYKDWQEFKIEKARIELQNKLENDQAERHVKMLTAQKLAGVSVIHAEKEVVADIVDTKSFDLAVKNLNKPTGFKELDAWNSAIRPTLATLCIILWVLALAKRDWLLTPWDLELISAVLGIFIGSRISSTGK